MVDEGRIAFTPAVEISYLNEVEQEDLVDAIQMIDATPNLSQACRFKKMSTEGQGLTPESIVEVLSEEKANQKERIKIPTEKLRKYFPKNYTLQQMEDEIINLCEKNYRTKQRDAR
jgi:ParB family chromosome partitioning protein